MSVTNIVLAVALILLYANTDEPIWLILLAPIVFFIAWEWKIYWKVRDEYKQRGLL